MAHTTTAAPQHPKKHLTKKTLVILGVVIVALATTAAAAVLFFGKAKVSGGVQSSTFSAKFFHPGSGNSWGDVNVTGTGLTCSGDTASDGTLTLNVTKAYPGGVCTVKNARVYVPSSSEEAGVVKGIDLTLPTGWTVTMTSGCGTTASKGTGETGSALVDFKVEMGANAAPGGATFDPDSGVLVSPQSLSSSTPMQAGCTTP